MGWVEAYYYYYYYYYLLRFHVSLSQFSILVSFSAKPNNVNATATPTIISPSAASKLKYLIDTCDEPEDNNEREIAIELPIREIKNQRDQEEKDNNDCEGKDNRNDKDRNDKGGKGEFKDIIQKLKNNFKVKESFVEKDHSPKSSKESEAWRKDSWSQNSLSKEELIQLQDKSHEVQVLIFWL